MDDFTEYAVAWATSHGLLLAHESTPGMDAAPFSLFPRPLPRSSFEKARKASVLVNELIDAIAQEPTWLFDTLTPTAEADDEFTGQLLRLGREVIEEGRREPGRLLLLRTDFMLDEGGDTVGRPLQVEMNTIAASLGTLTGRVAGLHRVLQDRLRRLPPALVPRDIAPFFDGECPPNAPERGFAAALAGAQSVYETHFDLKSRSTVVLFVIQKGERNQWDQRGLEFAMETDGVVVVRRTLEQVAAIAETKEDGRVYLKITTDGSRGLGGGGGSGGGEGGEGKEVEVEVAVAYYRAGYDPKDYEASGAWAGRGILERGACICVPDVVVHLAGAKRVQQALAGDGVVERFLGEVKGAQLRETFAGLWPLDPTEVEASPESRAALARARGDPHSYVIKPQREGGGHNIYGIAVATSLDKWDARTLKAHILMERIHPAALKATMMRKGVPIEAPAICEFGFFSHRLVRNTDNQVLGDDTDGHLVRTKAVGTDEGGVAAGFAVVDSPILLSDDDYLEKLG